MGVGGGMFYRIDQFCPKMHENERLFPHMGACKSANAPMKKNVIIKCHSTFLSEHLNPPGPGEETFCSTKECEKERRINYQTLHRNQFKNFDNSIREIRRKHFTDVDLLPAHAPGSKSRLAQSDLDTIEDLVLRTIREADWKPFLHKRRIVPREDKQTEKPQQLFFGNFIRDEQFGSICGVGSFPGPDKDPKTKGKRYVQYCFCVACEDYEIVTGFPCGERIHFVYKFRSKCSKESALASSTNDNDV